MRRHIDVRVVKGDSFRVAYIGDDPQTVMRVTNGLAALFIEEQLRDREELADGTNHFLEAQLADARQRLAEHEKKLEQYRRRFSGELPSQLDSNLQVIQNLQLQIQALTDSAGRDDDRRTLLQRELREAERELESQAPAAAPDAGPRRTDSGGTSARLESARSELAALERRLGAAHPDLQRMREAVGALESTVAREAALQTSVQGQTTPRNPQAAVRRARVADLRLELEQLDRQLTLKRAEETRLRDIGQRYEQRIERAPARESELAELTRDYSTLQGVYQTLLAKQEESKIAANLERRQIGAQFKLLDPARAAEKPSSPRRWFINLAGIAAGLAFALALVICLEYRDRTLNSDEEVKHALLLPVLAVVPLVELDEERRTHSRRRVLATGAVAGLVTLCIPIVIYSCLQ
jgi:polysaccharide chain length determinant protein (PEP-CTERM system associated)